MCICFAECAFVLLLVFIWVLAPMMHNALCFRFANGRPFVVELRDCHRPMSLTPESLDLLYPPPPEDGSAPVSVIRAHTASKAERDELVKAAGTSRKTYRCVVWAARAINSEDLQLLQDSFINVELQQLTPIRVLHRRVSAVRQLQAPSPATLTGFNCSSIFAVEKAHGALGQVLAREQALVPHGRLRRWRHLHQGVRPR
jgi:hypothetical protein